MTAFTADELDLLRDTVDRFVADHYPFARRPERLRRPPSAERWKIFSRRGLLGLPLQTDIGGLAADLTELQDTMMALGRGLVEEPFLSAVVLAARLLDDAGSNEQRHALLPGVVSGDRSLCLAHRELGSELDAESIATTAYNNGISIAISGHKRSVPSAEWADTYLVSARASFGIGLYLVPSNTPGIRVAPFTRVDGSYAADLFFDHVALPQKSAVGERETCAWPKLRVALLRGVAALCAEAAGIMRALSSATRRYLLMRRQFDRPLADFQALQHRFADMVIRELEAITAANMAAESTLDFAAPDAERRIRCAKIRAGSLGRRTAEEAIQLHGGIGYTDEVIVGHYLRRLLVIDDSLGSSIEHLGWLSEQRGVLE